MNRVVQAGGEGASRSEASCCQQAVTGSCQCTGDSRRWQLKIGRRCHVVSAMLSVTNLRSMSEHVLIGCDSTVGWFLVMILPLSHGSLRFSQPLRFILVSAARLPSWNRYLGALHGLCASICCPHFVLTTSYGIGPMWGIALMDLDDLNFPCDADHTCGVVPAAQQTWRNVGNMIERKQDLNRGGRNRDGEQIPFSLYTLLRSLLSVCTHCCKLLDGPGVVDVPGLGVEPSARQRLACCRGTCETAGCRPTTTSCSRPCPVPRPLSHASRHPLDGAHPFVSLLARRSAVQPCRGR